MQPQPGSAPSMRFPVNGPSEKSQIHEIHLNEKPIEKNYLKLEGRTKNAYKSLTMIYVIVVN